MQHAEFIDTEFPVSCSEKPAQKQVCLTEQQYNDNYTKHVGYENYDVCGQEYYSPENVRMISRKVTELLMGVHKDNKPIIVPDTTITSVMNDIYDNYVPSTGDIYTRYVVPNGNNNNSYIQSMIDQVIEVIVSDVKTNMLMQQQNEDLTIWTTVYGSFNDHGLRQHPPIKVRNKRPNPMQFNMNY